MKVAGEYTFEAPRRVVWEALQDPAVIASVMPGCKKLELVGENAYEGELNIKIGPVQGLFKGKIKLEDIAEPESYTMKVDGRGAPGFVKADAQVRLEEEDEQTRLIYDSDAQVGGRVASVGQRLLESSAKAIIKQSLDGLNTTMAARAATEASGGDATAVAPTEAPSEGELAAAVAKEVAKDVAGSRKVWMMVLLIAVLLAIYLYIR